MGAAASGRTFSRQGGISLISLMVGLTISMISVLAMAALFKTTLATSGTAGRGATSDGQRMAALFTAQTLLQGAGYGLDPAAFGTDLIVLSAGAALDASTGMLSGSAAGGLPATGSAIVWGAKAGADYACSGLYAPASGGLIRLSTTTCGTARDWSTIKWTTSVLVADTRMFSVTLTQAAAKSGCKSFGIGGSGAYLATLATTNSTDLSVAGSACLTNFTPAT